MSANVDATELQKFSAIAQRWWDPTGPMRPLHEINPIRTAWLDGHVRLAGQRVLDVGCGGGLLAEAMAARGACVTGIDMAGKPLEVARLHAQDSAADVRYLESTAEALAAREAAQFDVVTCMEVLEHVPDPAQTVAACAQLARPGGWCFFSTINRNAKSFALAIVGAEYVLKLLPKGTHEYAKFIRPSELIRHTRAAGLELVELTGVRYNPFTKRASLAADTDVNYLLACRKGAP
jgi:2-polyprenyl-6-hydroxyphenyl methylase/3-demethylubiquinone-9 3-methyltransferase